MKPWGFRRSGFGGSNELRCINPDCGAVVSEEGVRIYEHVTGCETARHELPQSAPQLHDYTQPVGTCFGCRREDAQLTHWQFIRRADGAVFAEGLCGACRDRIQEDEE